MKHLTKNHVFLLPLLVVALVHTASAQTASTLAPTPQGFVDVPATHWAYNATNVLFIQGIVEGNTHDQYRGNDPLTRYEFAVSMARLISAHTPPPVPPVDMGNYVTQEDFAKALEKMSSIEKRLTTLEEKVNTPKATVSANSRAELKVLKSEFVGLSKQVAGTAKSSLVHR